MTEISMLQTKNNKKMLLSSCFEHWLLEFGACLLFGAWNLEFSQLWQVFVKVQL